MKSKKAKILGNKAAHAKLSRMAWEIYEANSDDEKVVLVGIEPRGNQLVELLRQRLDSFSPLEVVTLSTNGGKDGTQVTLNGSQDELKGATVILVDDVLYSGKTLLNSLVEVVKFEPARVQVAALIDRGHRSLPVRPDFVGFVLGTTLKQYVSVEIGEEDKIKAFLF